MRYTNTRSSSDETVDSAQAIYRGLSPSGGLFVPEGFPSLSLEDIAAMSGLSYADRAAQVLRLYLTDYSSPELTQYARESYAPSKFDGRECAPLRQLDCSTWCLELWHGPTCAFKDMALQLLPHLLTGAITKVGDGSEVAILVATSGDTGKAALEGFADVPGTRIAVFYPEGGVSEIQKAQMVTQRGGNVHVVAVRGNFDDTQTGVKRVFGDSALAKRAGAAGISLSSANSINWGRLVPQIVYYISAYADLLASGSIEAGQGINFVVPTGNFGNILAGYYAKRMGLPISRLICASNENNVLVDFFGTRVYDRRREFRRTSSPSMDILISSNLERLLFEVAGRDGGVVSSWMERLACMGSYSLQEAGLDPSALGLFWADWASEEETSQAVAAVWADKGYLIDTHTAVAFSVLEKYRQSTQDSTPAVVISTASPLKFASAVARALMTKVPDGSEYELLEALADFAQVPVPPGLRGLDKLPVRHAGLCDAGDMTGEVASFLGI